MDEKTPLEKAIAAVGSQAALAAAVGLSQQAISYWVKKDGRVPAEMVLAVERASNVSRHDLRPDIFGSSPNEVAA